MDPIKRYKAVLNAEVAYWESFDFNWKIVKVKVRLIRVHIYYFVECLTDFLTNCVL